MEIKDYESLKRKLCKELEEIKEHKNMGMAEIELIDKITHAIKNIEYIMEREDGGTSSYGHYGRSYGENSYGRSYDGSYNGTYDNGMSGRNRHYVRGHYSYGGGDDVMDALSELMESSNLSLDDKSVLRKAMEVLRK